MERKRFCVTFFLRRARISKAGLAPILARITTNGVSKEVYIQCSVPADRWNQAKEWATGRDKLCRQCKRLSEYPNAFVQRFERFFVRLACRYPERHLGNEPPLFGQAPVFANFGVYKRVVVL